MATAPKSVAKPGAKGANLQAVPASEDGGAAAPGKSKKKLVLLLGILVPALAGGGFAAWHFLGGAKAPEAGQAGVVKVDLSKPPVFIVMEPFTVNLQSEGIEQFLQLSFTLQVFDPAQVELIKLYMPQVRSRLLLLLSSKKASEIATADGKKQLAEEIAAQVNQPFGAGMPKQQVSAVFFTSFVIQ